MRVAAGGRKGGVLSKKSVPGMDGVGIGAAGDVDQRIDPKVTVSGRATADRIGLVGEPDMARGAVALRVDGNRSQAEVTARADQTYRDFAAIGYENLVQDAYGQANRIARRF